MKQYLSNPPMLKQPNRRTPYTCTWRYPPHTISAVIVKEKEAIHAPVYYTSHALRGIETKYLRIGMLAFALVTTAKRLWLYFQAHPMKVLIEHPLRRIMQKPGSLGRLVRWLVEIGKFDIDYVLRSVVKGQAMVDFIAEFTVFPAEVEVAPHQQP